MMDHLRFHTWREKMPLPQSVSHAIVMPKGISLVMRKIKVLGYAGAQM
jgi:hypothetical protein